MEGEEASYRNSTGPDAESRTKLTSYFYCLSPVVIAQGWRGQGGDSGFERKRKQLFCYDLPAV